MLTSLSIKNYALIDKLQVDFNNGLTIITGETGAGKSILLGGLSLILGKRAELSNLKDRSQKCIIEAIFDIENYNLKSFFKDEDLDYESHTIIRRELLPSGKSRAFINDSPVTLNSLQNLGNQLIDMHSQHQTLQLVNDDFQFDVIDALANNGNDLKVYVSELSHLNQIKKELAQLKINQSEAIKEYDYNSFLLNELNEAELIENELEQLEEEYETLNNIEDIKDSLAEAHQLLNDESVGVINNLTEVKNLLSKLAHFGPSYKNVFERIQSSLIEIDDVFSEINDLKDQTALDPRRLEVVDNKLKWINNLLQKHVVNSISELVLIKNQLNEKVSSIENLDQDLQQKEQELNQKKEVLNSISEKIHTKRNKAIPKLSKQLISILDQLGMPNAQFNIKINFGEQFFNNGKDELSFLFSANKGGRFNELKKAASGGELSRIMLAIKSILSNYKQMPSIMFDEIDSGVSGEISNKMGDIMLQMSTSMQVFTITHLPQIAAKGHTHFKVFKEDVNEVTTTNLVKLNHDDRVVEIAQMLGGMTMSNSAIAHAKELLN